MARARPPVPLDLIDAADPEHYPDIDSEGKPDSYGFMDGRIVAVDYGLSSAPAVRERREYLATKSGVSK